MLKGDEDFEIELNNIFDVSSLKKIVKNFDKEWLIDTRRQETEYTHKDTMSYFIYKHPLDWKLGQNYMGTDVGADATIKALVDPIVKTLESLYNGKVGQCLLIKLPGNESIRKHFDSGDYLMSARRNHIPIITNKNVTFTVGNKTVSMSEGECWEINNAKNHSVNNNSPDYRVNLLIDILPNRFFL